MTIFKWLKERQVPFANKKLIQRAFVHSSYVNENKGVHYDNERLEFIGDAVLQLWTSKKLFLIEPFLDEGKMTTLRAALVREEALAHYGRELGLNQFLMLGQGEEKSGGRERDSLIANMFEAFVGALFLDQGFVAVDIILAEVFDFEKESDIKPAIIDYKTQLQEFVQADSRQTVQYIVINVAGPSNSPEFEVAVMLDDITLGIGRGFSKKKAEQQAAKNAFDKLVK